MESGIELSSKLRKNLYKRWWSMMQRCYNSSDKDYHIYGGRGVTVCQSWHIFENFLSDAVKLPGFCGEDMLGGGKILDKDTTVNGSILYSRDCCCFVSKTNSNKCKPSQMHAFIATAPNGAVYESTNQSEFALNHNLTQGTISSCLRGLIKKHQGWSFAYK